LHQELGNVGHGSGVAAVDALVDDFAEQIAEEDGDGIRRGEIVEAAGQRLGNGLVLTALEDLLAIMMRAKGGVSGAEHPAAGAFGVSVGALRASMRDSLRACYNIC